VSVAGQETGRDYSPELQSLIGRQLPVIAKRLTSTLEKLQRPQTENDQYILVDDWWETLKRQYLGNDVEFEAHGDSEGIVLPRSLAESVADNLIQNALTKRLMNSELNIRVSIECAETVEFRVCDSGHAVPAELQKLLFCAPVPSDSGLGIGLYQAARHAEANGYILRLVSNRDGNVCFLLAGKTTATAS
jgi:K+-sensing histidine kinase KdpD